MRCAAEIGSSGAMSRKMVEAGAVLEIEILARGRRNRVAEQLEARVVVVLHHRVVQARERVALGEWHGIADANPAGGAVSPPRDPFRVIEASRSQCRLRIAHHLGSTGARRPSEGRGIERQIIEIVDRKAEGLERLLDQGDQPADAVDEPS